MRLVKNINSFNESFVKEDTKKIQDLFENNNTLCRKMEKAQGESNELLKQMSIQENDSEIKK